MRTRWLVAALWIAACAGNHSGSDVDAAIHGNDASYDARVDAAPEMGVANVQVLGDYVGDVIVGLPVVFSAKDGSVIAVEMTDATGKAAHVIPRDTNVTVIRPSGNQGTVTLVGVQPNASLRFGSLYTALPTIAHMTVSWPSTTAGSFYDVETTCGGFGAYYQQSSGAIDIDNRCAGHTFNATIASYRNGRVQSYLTLANVTPVAGGSIVFTGSWIAAPLIDAAFTMPIGSRLDGVLAQTYDQRRFFDGSNYMPGNSTDGTGHLLYTLPPAPGSELHHQVTVRLNNGSAMQVVGRRLTVVAQVGFDVVGALYASLTSGSFDAPSRTLHWTTEAGAAPQIVRAVFHYHHSGGPYPTWIVVAPGDVTSVTPPQLPASLAMYNLASTDQVSGSLELVHVAKDYGTLANDLVIWLGRSNINTGDVDWMGAPVDLTGYTMSVGSF